MAADYKFRKPFDRITYEDLLDDVKQADSLDYSGNVIPNTWWQADKLKYENGKPNSVAIITLSEIVFWYRSSENTDDRTGERGRKPKITVANVLQKSYAKHFAEKFGFTKRQVQEACHFLRDRGIIEIFTEQKFTFMNGKTEYNVTFFRPIFDVIKEFTKSELKKENSKKEMHVKASDEVIQIKSRPAKEPVVINHEHSHPLISNLAKVTNEFDGGYIHKIHTQDSTRLDRWVIGFNNHNELVDLFYKFTGDRYNPFKFATYIDNILKKREEALNLFRDDNRREPQTLKEMWEYYDLIMAEIKATNNKVN